MSTPERRPSEGARWVVDAIDGDVARVEVDGERMINVPRSMLPSAAREGSVLAVARDSPDDERTTITIAVDAAATASALERSRAQVAEMERESRRRDPGGDVAL